MKNIIFVGSNIEIFCGFKLLLNQRTQWCDYIEEVMKIKIFNPNNYFESSASLNQSRFPFRILIYHYHKIKLVLFIFLMSQKDTLYVHIGSTLCLRTLLRKYNAGRYASGTDIAMHLRPFVLIAYICSFRKDRHMIEYTKYH